MNEKFILKGDFLKETAYEEVKKLLASGEPCRLPSSLPTMTWLFQRWKRSPNTESLSLRISLLLVLMTFSWHPVFSLS